MYISLLHTVGDRPELKYLNRYVKERICAAGPVMWLDLGVELLGDNDIMALNVIKINNAEVTVRCFEMFKLWLERQPKASWRQLIYALKQIQLNALAFNIEELLSVRQTGEETGTVIQILMADHPTLTQHIM